MIVDSFRITTLPSFIISAYINLSGNKLFHTFYYPFFVIIASSGFMLFIGNRIKLVLFFGETTLIILEHEWFQLEL